MSTKQLRLTAAPIFQPGMILQREKAVILWGTGAPGQTVTATIQNQSASAPISADGHWQLQLPPLTASFLETLTISSHDEVISFSDVAVGEVWLAGGQSNMEFHMAYEKFRQEEFALPPNSRLRFYDAPKVCYPGQLTDFDYSSVGIWRTATPEDLKYFTAVGYYFQKDLAQALDVPVGIIGCNWGGTTSSVWMSRESVERLNNFWWKSFLEKSKDVDWDSFYAEAGKDPFNDKGSILEDPFSQFIMPNTPGPEEIKAFMGDTAPPDFTVLMPQTVPGCLYEHMLRPLAPYSVRGVLWYQGESDDEAPDASLYQEMLSTMIADWRKLWQEELPFLVVQLPGWERWLDIENHAYHLLRRSQELVAGQVPGVYLCSISDAGEQYDIHPKNKRVVGQRLALLARGHVYGEDILCDAPCLLQASREGQALVLSFANVGSSLVLEGEKVNSLVLTQDGASLPYTATLRGSQLILCCAVSPAPVTISFAQKTWYLVNLYNEAGIPAIPFTAIV